MKNINTNEVMDKSNKEKEKINKYPWLIVSWFIFLILDLGIVVGLLCMFIFAGDESSWWGMIFGLSISFRFLLTVVYIPIFPFLILPAKKFGKQLIKEYNLGNLWTASMFFPVFINLTLRKRLIRAEEEMKFNPRYTFEMKISKGLVNSDQNDESNNNFRVQKYHSVEDKISKLDDLKKRGLINETEYHHLKEDIVSFDMN